MLAPPRGALRAKPRHTRAVERDACNRLSVDLPEAASPVVAPIDADGNACIFNLPASESPVNAPIGIVAVLAPALIYKAA